jgi:Outer membrane protein beta-barrel domain
MRTLALLTTTLLLAGISAQEPAQHLQPPLYGHHGPRFGLGMATQSTGGLFQNTDDLLLGPVFGWCFEAPLHPQLVLQPEVLWMVKGSVVRNQAQGVRSRSTFHYLEVPVLVKISTDKQSNGMFLLAGPSMGYYLTGRYQQWLNGQLNTDIKYDLSENEKRFQFSVVLGMGTEGERWGFDVRAQTSLTPFQALINVQNVVYALTFSYRIKSHKPPKEEPEAE